jgi:hypothetical protein
MIGAAHPWAGAYADSAAANRQPNAASEGAISERGAEPVLETGEIHRLTPIYATAFGSQ